MLSFVPRILSLVFAPSPVIVVVSPSSPLIFNDDKLAPPLPSSSSLSALDQLRYIQNKFNIQTPLSSIISSDEKRTNKSLTVLVQLRKESARGGVKVVDAGRRESGSSSIPSCVEAAASKGLRHQKLQDKVDELLKLSRFEVEEEDEFEETRRRERSRRGDFKRELSRQAALKGLRWQEQRRLVEKLILDSRITLDEDEEDEELLQFGVVEEEEVEGDMQQTRVLATVVVVEADVSEEEARTEIAERDMHRSNALATLTSGTPHTAATSRKVHDWQLYNFIADSRSSPLFLRLPASGVPGVWARGEEEQEKRNKMRRERRRVRVAEI